jgi:hypothetical protein
VDALTKLSLTLEAKFKLVNERIARGENKYIKLKAASEKRCWSLIYPIEAEPINSSFYSQLPGIGIANLLCFVATKTGFLRAFTHVLDRYLVGFMHPNHYKDFLIKPVRKVFDSLIGKEWPNVQRIVTSLAQKRCDASDHRPQARFVSPPEPDQEGTVGIG